MPMRGLRMPTLPAIAFATLALLAATSATLQRDSIPKLNGPFIASRPRRSGPIIVTDCMTVASESGRYFVKAPPDADGRQVCGVYFMADADRTIRLQFDYFDVPCQGGGLVAFVDGWELGGEVFPGSNDHEKELDDRFEEFCGKLRIRKVLQASQNGALVQYRFPESTDKQPHGFSFTVRHISNPTPCNVLAEQGKTNIYTMRNYGRRVNCSVTMLAPSSIRVLAMQVGAPMRILPEHETGVLNKCRKRGYSDYVEIGGSKGLDTSAMTVGYQLCGLDSKPETEGVLVGCPISTARLVSSGGTDNSVTLVLRTADATDFELSEIASDPVLCLQ